MAESITIGCNNDGEYHFDDISNVRTFAEVQSSRLAGLLCVLKACGDAVEPHYVNEAMQIASDMAWELQQAIEILNKQGVPYV